MTSLNSDDWLRIGIHVTGIGATGGSESFVNDGDGDGGSDGDNQVPEPAILALFGLGLGLVASRLRKRT